MFSFEVGGQPHAIAVGPDDSVYWTDTRRPGIGLLSSDGAHVEFDVPTPADHIFGLAIEKGGTLWVTEWSDATEAQLAPHLVSRISADGTSYSVASVWGHGTPREIVVAPSGLVWFTVGSGIGCISDDGAISVNDVPWHTPWVTLEAQGVAIDGDGRVLVTVSGPPNRIAVFDPVRRGWRWHDLPDEVRPSALAVHPDGTIWLTSFHHNVVGRVHPSGRVELTPGFANPCGITISEGGDVWVAEFGAHQLARLSTSDVSRVATYATPEPLNIAIAAKEVVPGFVEVWWRSPA